MEGAADKKANIVKALAALVTLLSGAAPEGGAAGPESDAEGLKEIEAVAEKLADRDEGLG